jgi:hypothetical protein
MAEIANLDRVLSEAPLSRDFRRKYQRKFTDKESNKVPLSEVYDQMGVGNYN